MNKHIHPDVVDSQGQPANGAIHVSESNVIWEEAEGQVVNLGWFLLSVVLFWLILPVLITAWKIWQTSNHRYTLTSQRLREQSGVLVKDTEELELYRVKDISIHQPLLQHLLGRGHVILLTSDRSTPKVVLSAVANPHAVADLIRRHVEQCRVLKGVREID
jgi:uncharacterized membrane protein YdbT with pleckstrin-like domain